MSFHEMPKWIQDKPRAKAKHKGLQMLIDKFDLVLIKVEKYDEDRKNKDSKET